MNSTALHLPCKLANSDKSVELHLSIGSQPIEVVTNLLTDRGYYVLPDIIQLQEKKCYCLLINTEIGPQWIIPFSRWLLRKANLTSIQTKLEDSDGNIIVQCNLYR